MSVRHRGVYAAAAVMAAGVLLPAPAVANQASRSSPWQPTPGTSWQWEIVGRVSQPYRDVSMYDIDRRQDYQQNRIEHGIQDGQITRSEAYRLEQGERAIDRAQAHARADGLLDEASHREQPVAERAELALEGLVGVRGALVHGAILPPGLRPSRTSR